MSNASEVHCYCRILLAEVMKEVRKRYTKEQIGTVWTWEGARKHFEFHGPNQEYLYNLRIADCHWSAKAEGWQQLMDRSEDA